MSVVLGIIAVFHDPAAALVVDGEVAAAEEERFARRKHGKKPVAFTTWGLPVAAARWCLAAAGIRSEPVDAVAYSYHPALARRAGDDVAEHGWEDLRTRYVRRAPLLLRNAPPGLDPARVRFVAHHVAHAASASHVAGFDPRDALECFGSAPIDALVLGPCVVRHAPYAGDVAGSAAA